MSTRREFLQQTAVAGVVPFVGRRQGSLVDLNRPPTSVIVQTNTSGDRVLRSTRADRWEDGDVVVSLSRSDRGVLVRLSSPSTALRRLRFRWTEKLESTRFVLGDAWERGYGDLEWRGFVPDRVMPWYFAASDGRATHAYGVRTGASALCFWQVDPQGLTLWADVRSGGSALALGNRELTVCEVVCRQGAMDESPFAALHAFCAQIGPGKVSPPQAVYGSNDWYWAYGRNSAQSVLVDAHNIVDLSPTGSNRPFVVIDDGWQPERGQPKGPVGQWDRGNEKFPDMPGLAGEIRKTGARPGAWIRPLLAPADAPETWRLSRDRAILDPSVPEVRQKIRDDIRRLRQWGYDLIKHDYSTFDIFGRWGSTMGETLTRDGWTFAGGPARTTAEVINDLYKTIREAADVGLLIGCNTVSHLSAGVFDICRIGDDTSGREWARTRKMGVNALAFRGAQHGAFYIADADCVGVTNAIPWRSNRQWLDLLARSGTMLFVSIAPDALGAEQRTDLRAALAHAAQPQPLAEPLDWQQSTCPARWRLQGGETMYTWFDD